jgi:hypothetical protein
MGTLRRKILWGAAAVAWIAAMTAGLSSLWRYEAAIGATAATPDQWPSDAGVSRSTTLPTLVMFIHPKCPCSRATLDELAKLMTRCHEKLAASICFVRPRDVQRGWEQTDLWRTAAAIPGVTVSVDDEAGLARRFGAATSGITFLYSPQGQLLFSGGITKSRGHSGDNPGRAAIEALVLRGNFLQQPIARTPVFGCALMQTDDSCEREADACHR